MKSSFKNRLKFFILEWLLPCWRLSGRKVEYFSDDYHEIRMSLPCKRINRGPHGYTYGGAIFSSVDAIPAFQYFLILGRDYVVWDKEATIHFKLPCKKTLYMQNSITVDEISEIKSRLDKEKKFERSYTINLVDSKGLVHVQIDKVLHFRKNIHDGRDKNNQTRSRLL